MFFTEAIGKRQTMKKDKDKKPDSPTIKEGLENSSTPKNKVKTGDENYPRKSEKDEQYDSQPEFIDRDSDDKDKQ